MASELHVIIKGDNEDGEEKTLRTKFLIYDTYVADENDPIIKDCVEKSLNGFNGQPSDIRVQITIEIL